MKNNVMLITLVIMLLSCNTTAKYNQIDQWQLVQIGLLYGEGALNDDDQKTLSKLKQISLSVENDTLCINDKYKAKIVKRKALTDTYFGDSETLKNYFVNEFKAKGVNVIDSISYWDLGSYPSYSDFSFTDYSLWGTIIGNEDCVCLVYHQVFVLWFEKNNNGSFKKEHLNEKSSLLNQAGNTIQISDSLDKNATTLIDIAPSQYTLPYSAKLDYKSVKYELLSESKIMQSDDPEQACYSEDGTIRYISMPVKGEFGVIIVPHDGGDFPYRYYLHTIKGNKIIDGLYVEGEWWEPEEDGIEETTFSISADYIISVSSTFKGKTHVTQYYINNKGEFCTVKMK